MKIPGIKMHRAKDFAEACSLLHEFGDSARAIAGGTDVVVDLKQKRYVYEHIITLDMVSGNNEILVENNNIRIGALVTLAAIADNPVIQKYVPALSDAAMTMATPQVRNMGTIGGNVAMAVPSADLPPSLIAANAHIVTESVTDTRIIPIREFFKGPRQTVLRPAELISEIVIEILPETSGISYQKFQLRNAAALAVVGVAAYLDIVDGKISDACISLGAVAPTPLIAAKASKFLIGKEPSEENFQKAGNIACDEGKPISDIRGSKEFRCRLIGVLTTRALKHAAERAVAGSKPSPRRRKK